MKKFLLAASVVLFMTVSANAQDAPRVELFGGYSYLRVDAGLFHINTNGWNASITGNVNNWFGITGDVSAHYRSGLDLYTFVIGPRFAAHGGVTPFTHLLFGGARAGNGDSDTSFAMVLGGGLDADLPGPFALRLAQLDYHLTRFGGNTQSNLRYSAGIVIRF
jgi:opacity protein-like surface antigen